MLSDTLETVGIPRGDYLVRVNNRKVLNGVLEVMGLGDDQAARDNVLRTIDKFDKVGEQGVRELLTKGRLDASGAYIDGVGLSDDQAAPVLAFLTSKAADAAGTIANLRAAIGTSEMGAKGVAELEQIGELLAALREKGRISAQPKGPVVVTVMDRDRMADYQAMVSELRNAGIRAEVYLGNPKNFGNQLKYADKRNSPVAVIEGGDEKANGIVQIKDLILGAQIAQSATLEEWKERPSQFEVPRDQLVAKVREILDGQG
jgi:histidyl-tRNA synthetase